MFSKSSFRKVPRQWNLHIKNLPENPNQIFSPIQDTVWILSPPEPRNAENVRSPQDYPGMEEQQLDLKGFS